MPENHHLQPETMAMKTFTQQNLPEETGTLSRFMTFVLLMGTLLTPIVRVADANQSFQYKTLFNPTPSQLKAEERGRVMIYDGLDNAAIERALDQQFGRIEHMMFTRIHEPPPKDDGTPPNKGGEDSSDDDGC
jgi:hypothetical protein